MKSFLVKTLGCKANAFDSQIIEAELKRRGWQTCTDAGAADLVVINSCTVTDEADRQTRKLASRLRRENPNAKIVVTGCGAEVAPELLAKSVGISYVVANRDKPKLVALILKRLEHLQNNGAEEGGEVLGVAERYETMASRHPMDREWPAVDEFANDVSTAEEEGIAGKTRAFLKIQEGCNSFCTYCVIPYGRGPSRSLRADLAVDRMRELTEAGYREAVLTGTNIGDFGSDFSETTGIEDLVEKLLKETSIERIRLGSLDPIEISDRLIDLMVAEDRICAHLHVSLQSPSERILKLMKRRYGRLEIEACFNRIKKLENENGGPFIGMDVITGFPGETAEMFKEGAEYLMTLPWTRLHVFPYSEREGTPATRLQGVVPKQERLARSRLLNDLSLERMRTCAENLVGSVRKRGGVLRSVLLENEFTNKNTNENWISGYTKNYWRVSMPCRGHQDRKPNSIVDAKPEQISVDRQGSEITIISS